MAVTTDELDFKLILDDLEFNTKVQADLDAAKQLNVQLSQLLQVKRKVAQVSKDDVANHRRQLQMQKDAYVYAQMQERAKLQTMMQQERYNQLLAKTNEHHLINNRFLREALTLAGSYVSIWGAKQLVSNIIRTTGEFELQRTTLAAMLQDAQKAEQIFEQIKAFSVESPFAFKELATYAKQLTAFSVPVSELFDTTKMLADVSAGLGVGMDRLVLAYGQVRSAAFLRGQEVRQFTEAGIPILEELRKQFVELGEEGITVGDVFDKISKRMVSFEMVDKVFKDLTSEGGKFYQMQEIQADTLKGKIANLTDAFDIMFATIGERHQDILKGGVDTVRDLALNYEKVGRAIIALIATYGTYKATLVAIKVIEEAALIAGAQRVSVTTALGKAIKLLTSESAAYAAIQKLIASINPWAAVAAAVGAVGTYLIAANAQTNRFHRELEDISKVKFEEADKGADNFRRLAEQLKNSTVGSQNYRDAISRLNREYGDYLPNLLNEKNALTEILKVENQVVNAIYARAKAYAYESGVQKIEDRMGESVRKAGDGLAKALEGYRVGSDYIGEDVAADFVKGFREALLKDGGKPFEVFQKEAQRYFGRTFVNFQKSIVNSYAESVRELASATDDFGRSVEMQFGSQGYSSLIDKQIAEPIETAYQRAKAALEDMKLPVDEYQEKLKALDLGRLYQLKMAYEEMDQEAQLAGKEGSWGNRIKEISDQIAALKPKDLSWLQKMVNPLVSGDGNRDLKADELAQYDEYLEKLRNEYKKVSASYADASKTYDALTASKTRGESVDASVLAKAKELNDTYEERKKVIEKIGEALGVSVDDKTSSKSRTRKAAKSQAQIELETRIDLLKKLQSAYEQLGDFMERAEIPDTLKGLFSASGVTDDMVRNLDFRKQLVEAAKELEGFDSEAADKLRNYLGYDETTEQIERLKELKKAQKEAQQEQERYQEFMDGWILGGELEGEGSQFKISKILSNYEKALQQIDQKTEEARQKLYKKAEGEKKVGIWSALGFAADYSDITTKSNLAKSNALAQYSEEGRKAIKEMYKDWRDGAMDFNNLSDKSINQLRKMREMIQEVALNEIVPKDQQENLAKLGLGLKEIEDIINKLKENDTGDENGKGILGLEISDMTAKKLKYIANQILNMASAVREYAEVAGNDGLASAMEAVEGIADVTRSAAEGFRQVGVLGAVVGGVSSLFQKAMEAATASAKLKAEIASASLEAERFNAAAKLSEGADTLFGTNAVQSIRNAVSVLKEYRSLVNADNTGADALMTWKSGLFNLGRESKSLKDMVEELGYSLYDKNGILNTEALNAVLQTYDKLTTADREWIEEAIKNAEIYTEAMQELDGVIQETWSSIADDMTDKLITARTEVGDAYAALADDMREVFGDAADDIARKLISSFIVDNILSKYTNDLREIYNLIGADGSNDEVVMAFSSLADNVMKDAGIAADFTNQLYDAFERAGVDISKAAEGANNLSDGIKGTTEDTANLLASYLNAIRADVSVGRVQRDTIVGYLERIASYVAVPTLMDHLNRIQANTYDTAVATQGILSNLQSVITAENGPSAIRVLS